MTWALRICTAGALSIVGAAATAAPVFFDFEAPLARSEAIVLSLGEDGLSRPLTPRVRQGAGGGVLRLRERDAPAEGGGSLRVFVPLIEDLKNPNVTALINATGGSDDRAGVLARGNVATLSGYTAAVNFGANRFELLKTVGGKVMVVAETPDALPDPGGAYTVNLKVIGSLASARFLDEAGETLLGALSYDDVEDPLPAGFVALEAEVSGLAVSTEEDTLDTSFDNFAVSEVPLPATAWLTLAGLGGLAAIGRRLR